MQGRIGSIRCSTWTCECRKGRTQRRQSNLDNKHSRRKGKEGNAERTSKGTVQEQRPTDQPKASPYRGIDLQHRLPHLVGWIWICNRPGRRRISCVSTNQLTAGRARQPVTPVSLLLILPLPKKDSGASLAAQHKKFRLLADGRCAHQISIVSHHFQNIENINQCPEGQALLMHIINGTKYLR